MSKALDLGLAGRKAIVCGASSGLGKACALALAQAGVAVTMNAREESRLKAAADEIAAVTGSSIVPVAADVSTAEGRALILAACPAPDILVNNAGGPPPGDFRAWDDGQWMAALHANMLAPISLIRSVIDPMIERRWGRIINITSRAVKMPLPLLGLSNGARAGLTGFVSGLAREVAPFGVTINNLLPGPFATDRLSQYAAKLGAERGMTAAAALSEMAQENPTRRVGRPEEFGAWCAFLASEHAGYVTAQNFLLDGGAYPGVF